MPFKIDLHTHSFFSGDGVSSPEQNIAAARAKGLDGFVLTDHNTNDGVEYLRDKGLIREDGLPVDDFLVIPGVEVTTAEGHLLCIGASLPYLKGRPARGVCELIHERGGLAIPPHPYDLFRAGIRFSTLQNLPIDALEVFNAATTLRRYNRYAFKYAQMRGLPMTAASDAHHHAAIGTAYTILNTEDFSLGGILAQLVKSNELNEQYLTPRDSVRKTWNNWMRLRRRKTLPTKPAAARVVRPLRLRSANGTAPEFRLEGPSRRTCLTSEQLSQLLDCDWRFAGEIFANVGRGFAPTGFISCSSGAFRQILLPSPRRRPEARSCRAENADALPRADARVSPPRCQR